MSVCHGTKFTIGDGERLVRGLFYMLLGFDSLQFSVDCPTVPALPVSHFRAKLEGLGKLAEMKRLKRRVLGWAPRNPLAPASGAVDSITTSTRLTIASSVRI